MSASPRSAAVLRGAAAGLSGSAVSVLLGLATAAALARLVAPADYGVYFLAFVVVETAGVVLGFGVAQAVVAVRSAPPELLRALLRRDVVLEGGLALAVAAAGPPLALLTGVDEVVPVLLVLAVAVWLDGLAAVPLGLAQRRLRFGRIAVVETGSLALGAVVGVTAAALGAGLWALVAQMWVYRVGRSAGLLAVSGLVDALRGRGDVDTLPVDDVEMAALRRFGRDVVAGRLVAQLARRVDQVVVAVLATTAAVGLYGQATRYSMLPVSSLQRPLLGVAVASLARRRDDPAGLRGWARTGVLGLFTLVWPALALLGAETRTVVLVLLGPDWVEAVPLLRLLVVGAAAWAVVLVLKWPNYAEGQADRQLRASLAVAPALLLGVVVGSLLVPDDPALGVAAGVAAGTVVGTVPAVLLALAGSQLRPRDLAGSLLRPAAASAALVVALLLVGPLLPDDAGATGPALLRLLLVVPVAVLAAAAGWLAPPGGPAAARKLSALVVNARRGR